MQKEIKKPVRKNKGNATNPRRPRRPDYRGKNVAVWMNENSEHKWLTIKIDGMNEKFVAFENEN